MEQETKTATLEDDALDLSMLNEDPDHNVGSLVPSGGDSFGMVPLVAQATPIKRDYNAILNRIRALALQRGEDYYYSWHVKKKGGGKSLIEGGTIVLAEDLLALYMNATVDTRVFDQGDHFVIYARFVDFEKGISYTRPFRQRKTQNVGKGFENSGDGDRALDMMMQIGVSKAVRNIVLRSLNFLSNEALKAAKDKIRSRVAQNPEGAKQNILARLKEHNISVERVERTIGKKEKDWLVQDMSRIWGELNALKDGFITADDLYPDLQQDAKADDRSELDKFEEGDKDEKKPDPTPESTPEPTPQPTPAPTGQFKRKDATPAPEPTPAPTPPPLPSDEMKDEDEEEAETEWADGDGSIPVIDLNDYDMEKVAEVAKAGKDLERLLQKTSEPDLRMKIYQQSSGDVLLNSLGHKGQGMIAKRIRELLGL